MAFQYQKQTPVTIRFSDFTGIPNIADTTGLSNPRGFAMKFHGDGGITSDMIMHSFNGFPVGNTDDFVELLTDISKSGPDAPHPNLLEQFFGTHPIAKTFLTSQKPPTTSYATLSFFGVNSFKLTNAKGVSKYVRYQLIPVAGEHFLTPEELKMSGPDYLSAEIKDRINKGQIQFKLYAQLSAGDDKIRDPSIAWPDTRQRIMLGTLTIKKLSENTVQEDKSLKFNPNNLSPGVTIADQMLDDRARAYPISVKNRQ
ncbi:catalase [Mucilaginibacter antarcticus]